jgi:hypothetical protein
MFDEEKVKRDLEKMRKAYENAIKEMDRILARQKEIAEKIYEIKQKRKNDN